MNTQKICNHTNKAVATSKPVAVKHTDSVVAILRPKLKIGQPNDKYEQEADRVAESIVNMPAPASQAQTTKNSLTPLPPSQRIQRLCNSCQEDTEILQKKSNSKTTSEFYPTIDNQINTLNGSGHAMPSSDRQFFEPRFSADFSNVRLHRDQKSANIAHSINARAFTLGHNIVFASGQYSPGSPASRKLLAHELTHVLQQSAANTPRDITGSENKNSSQVLNQTQSIQRDFAVQPVNPAIDGNQLTDTEVLAAIRYNSRRFFDIDELKQMRDVLGISAEPAVIDRDFVLAVASYQQQYGETIDGKIGSDSALTLSRELRAESALVPSLDNPATELAIRGRANQSARNIDSGGRTDIFDATLDHGNARLSLNMRVNFNFVNGGGGAWPDAAAQTDWQNDYVSRVQRKWSYKLLMRRQGTSRRYLSNYATRVRVQPSNASPHYTANVSYETAHAGSSVSNAGNTATLDSMDNDVRNRIRSGNTFNQRGASHEFGHMLGLDHIACDNNSDACYGVNRNDRNNIMGFGGQVTTANATPFTTAMRIITGRNWLARLFRTLT